jgi:hypothetical protein
MPVMGYRIAPLAKRTAREVLDDNVLGLAAANAYNFFFSLFPIFLFLAPLIGLIGDKHEVFNELMRQAARTVPPEAFALVRDVVESVVFARLRRCAARALVGLEHLLVAHGCAERGVRRREGRAAVLEAAPHRDRVPRRDRLAVHPCDGGDARRRRHR